MRKLIFLLVLPLFWGCDKNVEFVSNPQLNVNGRWIVNNIVPTYESTIFKDIQIMNSDYFAVSPLTVISYQDSSKLLVKNDTVGVKPCFFYKKGYVWEFDYNNLILKDNVGKIIGQYYVYYKDAYYSPNDFYLVDKNSGEYISGNWHINQNGNGSNPSNQLSITVPDISFDVNVCGRKFSRGITQHLFIYFGR